MRCNAWKNSIVRLMLLAMALALLTGCPRKESMVTFKNRTFIVEIADDDAERARGLMFRDAMPEDHGMLFVFNDLAPRAFWMHNCKISLDILYFDADLKLVSASENVPPCNLPPEQCPNYPSAAPAKYVLELNAGMAKRLGWKTNDVLTLDLAQ
jgi:uncharacterized protein